VEYLLSLTACPICGSAGQELIRQSVAGVCNSCNEPWRIEENVLIWSEEERQANQSRKPLFFRKIIVKARDPHWVIENIKWRAAYYLHPFKSPFSPLTRLTNRRVEQYYYRTLNDRDLAKEWANHYLNGLLMRPGACILDHGCGRGRHLGLASQLEYKIYGQDVVRHEWWQNLPNCGFQVVPPEAKSLPWRDQVFDMVLNIEVISFMSPESLESHAQEVLRVLRPGGYWIILEANSGSYGAHIPRKHYGRLHTLKETIQTATEAGFEELDASYEGFYAPFFPIFVDFFRKVCAPWPLDLADHRSWMASLIKQQRRALWLLRLIKPKASFQLSEG
jgi:SAM-dependent methyltransferase